MEEKDLKSTIKEIVKEIDKKENSLPASSKEKLEYIISCIISKHNEYYEMKTDIKSYCDMFCKYYKENIGHVNHGSKITPNQFLRLANDFILISILKSICDTSEEELNKIIYKILNFTDKKDSSFLSYQIERVNSGIRELFKIYLGRFKINVNANYLVNKFWLDLKTNINLSHLENTYSYDELYKCSKKYILDMIFLNFYDEDTSSKDAGSKNAEEKYPKKYNIAFRGFIKHTIEKYFSGIELSKSLKEEIEQESWTKIREEMDIYSCKEGASVKTWMWGIGKSVALHIVQDRFMFFKDGKYRRKKNISIDDNEEEFTNIESSDYSNFSRDISNQYYEYIIELFFKIKIYPWKKLPISYIRFLKGWKPQSIVCVFSNKTLNHMLIKFKTDFANEYKMKFDIKYALLPIENEMKMTIEELVDPHDSYTNKIANNFDGNLREKETGSLNLEIFLPQKKENDSENDLIKRRSTCISRWNSEALDEIIKNLDKNPELINPFGNTQNILVLRNQKEERSDNDD